MRGGRSGVVDAFASQKNDDFTWWDAWVSGFSAVYRSCTWSKENRKRKRLLVNTKIDVQIDNVLARILMNFSFTGEERHGVRIGRVTLSLKDHRAWSARGGEARPPPQAEKRGPELREIVGQLWTAERNGLAEYKKLLKTTEGLHKKYLVLSFKTTAHDFLQRIETFDVLR